MDERYSFLSLMELVEAKLARKLSLQAEIAKIDDELAQALSKLREVPSLASGNMESDPSIDNSPATDTRRRHSQRRDDDIPVVPGVESIKPSGRWAKKLFPKTCANPGCDRSFMGTAARRFCRTCFVEMARNRTRKMLEDRAAKKLEAQAAIVDRQYGLD